MTNPTGTLIALSRDLGVTWWRGVRKPGSVTCPGVGGLTGILARAPAWTVWGILARGRG